MDAILDTKNLGLPEAFMKKLGTDRIIIREVNEGLLLMPLKKEMSNLRGLIKGSNYGTDKYFEQKRHENLNLD